MLTRESWAGIAIGLGVGLMIGPALIELGWLHENNKAWVTLLGAVVMGVGILARGNPRKPAA